MNMNTEMNDFLTNIREYTLKQVAIRGIEELLKSNHNQEDTEIYRQIKKQLISERDKLHSIILPNLKEFKDISNKKPELKEFIDILQTMFNQVN